MSGTRAGGLKAAKKNLQKNPNFYRDIGRRGGGVKSPSRGFGSLYIDDDGMTGPQRARVAGRKGGLISRRGVRRNVQSI